MTRLEIAGVAAGTDAEGPHHRFAVWVQGCTLACPGCCNPEMFAQGTGRWIEVEALVGEISEARRQRPIEGITILGGEPLQQLDAVTAVCRGAASLGLGVIVFSGYAWAEAAALPDFDGLWGAIDTLVEGRFDARRPDTERRFIGSTNQGLVHRTARYADPTLWRGGPTVDIEVPVGGPLRLVGEPALVRRVARSLAIKP